jgi:Type IV secretion-system coupling protein DNA-binding domain
LVISAVWQAALARANLPPAQRRAFWLVIDEFQDVMRLPLDLADMLSQARGLGLGLTLAHQYMDQLSNQLRAAVIGTTRSHLVFQLGYTDAHDLAVHFSPLNTDDLQNLAAYEIALRPCINGTTAPPVTGGTYPLPEPHTDGAALAQASRQRYGLPITEVDEHATARTTTSPARRGRRWNRILTSGGDQP